MSAIWGQTHPQEMSKTLLQSDGPRPLVLRKSHPSRLHFSLKTTITCSVIGVVHAESCICRFRCTTWATGNVGTVDFTACVVLLSRF